MTLSYDRDVLESYCMFHYPRRQIVSRFFEQYYQSKAIPLEFLLKTICDYIYLHRNIAIDGSVDIDAIASDERAEGKLRLLTLRNIHDPFFA